MNDFENRWEALIGAARSAPSRDDTPPFGFAGRVTALRRTASSSSTFALWWKLTWRAIGFATLLLAVSAAMNWSSNDSALDPAIADSMSDALWLP